MTRRTTIALTVVMLVALLGWWGTTRYRAAETREAARRLMFKGNWREARKLFESYLSVVANDDEARIWLAEAFARDDDVPPTVAVEQAARHLQRVSDDSLWGAEARVYEGRLALFVEHRVVHAEDLLKRAVELDPDSVDAHYVLWKLYELTERTHLCEPHFLKVFENTAPSQRVQRMREWFLTEFNPIVGTEPFDRRMGFYNTDEKAEEIGGIRRLTRFMEQEPDSWKPKAFLARLMYRNQRPDSALDQLRKTGFDKGDAAHGALRDPGFLGILIPVLLEVGEFEDAERYFDGWPEDAANGEYLLCKGMILDESREQFEEAVVAYQQALEFWPGHTDWLTRNRIAHCLTRLGRNEEADEWREQVRRLQSVMTPDFVGDLREAVFSANDPDGLQRVVDFYTTVERPLEANWWSQVMKNVRRATRWVEIPTTPDN